jgi:methylphosphotriester-DNA--protein-cysteine methyltransferase
MRRKLTVKNVFVVIVVVLGFWSLAFSAEFYASRNSNKYHRPTCTWAYKIKQSNLIIFKSPEEAEKNGYIPCKVCMPPLPAI